MEMEHIDQWLLVIKDWVWSAPLLLFLIGSGIFLTYLLKGIQFRYLGFAFKQVFKHQKADAEGDISHFQALMTSLAGAIGTGTIVGVATAVTVGGLGAIFWMWVTALISMSTKYAESLLAVKYRIVDKKGEMSGGPMQYIERGLGWKWMAIVFAIFGSIAALGTGNLVQVNSISDALGSVWQADPWWIGIVISLMTGLILIGGVKSIGSAAAILVPFMALLYVGGGLAIICIHYDRLPEALSLIISSAFTGQAAAGGFLGSSIMMAIQLGVSRSVFSNEAGLGLSSIAAAAAKTDSPARQGLITMTGAFITTIIVCSITGLVLAVTHVLGKTHDSGVMINGVSLAIEAFSSTLMGGNYIVVVGLILFAFTTVIAWAYYGEKCVEYLFGERSIIWYRILYTLIIIPGAALKMETVWFLADIMNGLMVIPNMIAVIGLSGVVVAETRRFLTQVEQEEREQAGRPEGAVI